VIQSFPDIEFNLALQLPYLNGTVTDKDTVFKKGLETVKRISQFTNKRPHLRIVDPFTRSQSIPEKLNDTCKNIGLMAQSLSDINGILSLENSGQVGMWKNIWYIISTVKQHRDNIKLCYDPVNVLSSEPIFTKDLHKLTPYAPTAQGLKFIPWTSDDIAIFHIKQKKNLKVLDVVNEGDVDWDLQLDML